MNQSNLNNITIALAGVLQAIALVRELTQTGRANEVAFAASMRSIFALDASNIETVYGDLAGIKLGLEKIVHTFDNTQTIDRLQHRYMLSLMHLQKKLSRSPKILATLTQRLRQTQKQVDYFTLTHPTVIANLADTYQNTISTFKFRIIILGSQRVLHARENMEKVRALLLAGIRAAVLWRQVGGSRLQILFLRSKIKAAAEKILQQIEHNQIVQKDVL
jgi:high frequency lysogenization protein